MSQPTPCLGAPCSSTAIGHKLFWVHANVIARRPWGWRDAVVTEVAGLQSLCRSYVDHVEAGTDGAADASIVKLYYSELLQRITELGTEIVGVGGQGVLDKPLSSGWESGAWALDFISSWEWTIPGGASEIQRNIIAERGLDLPREPLPLKGSGS